MSAKFSGIMISSFLLILSLHGCMTRPIINGTQPMDHFLATGDELVNRLCQGPLGCGFVKTSYNSSYNPLEINSHDYYGKTNNTTEFNADREIDVNYDTALTENETEDSRQDSKDNNIYPHDYNEIASSTEEKSIQEGDYSTQATLGNGVEVFTPTPSEGLNETIEEGQESLEITFYSNETLKEIERAINILCKGFSVNCTQADAKEKPEHSDSDESTTPIDEKTSTNDVLIVTATVAAVAIFLSIICTILLCYKKMKACKSRQRDVEEGDGFEFVDLTFRSIQPSPPPPPPPTPQPIDEEVDEEDELKEIELGPIEDREEEMRISPIPANYIFDQKKGRYLQVTEL